MTAQTVATLLIPALLLSAACERHADAGAPLPDQETAGPPGEAPPGMVWVPGGEFTMGSDRHYPEEAPAHRVAVEGFWMDRFTVTNRQFGDFVEATGHVTLAERPADPADYPGALPEMLVPA